MIEADPNFRVNFLDCGDNLGQEVADLGVDTYVDYRRFREDGQERAVVLQSNDVLLLNTLVGVFEDYDPATWSQRGFRDAFNAVDLSFRFIGRLPRTTFSEDGNVVCEEGTCRFYSDHACNKKDETGRGAMQFDDNPKNQWCMNYVPLESIEANPPYPKSAVMERIRSDEDFQIKAKIMNNLRVIATQGDLQVGFTGLAGGLLTHLETGNIELQIADKGDEVFEKNPESMFVIGGRPIGHWARGSFLRVNRNYVAMRNEAPFSTDAMVLKALSLAVLEVAELPYIPVKHVGRVNNMAEVDAIIAHQLSEAPPEIIDTAFTDESVELHRKYHLDTEN